MPINFNVEGFDFSGIGNAVSQALLRSAQYKLEQDRIVQKELDDYINNYDEKKLRDSDLPDFVSAFKNYKDAALRYSRLNKAGAKPEEVALAGTLKDKALNNMNTIYKNSSMAKNLINERIQYRNDLYKQGIAVPSEVNDEVMHLTTTPASEIQFDRFTSPYDVPLEAGKQDLEELNRLTKNAPKGQLPSREDTTKSTEFNVTGYGKVKIPYIITEKGANVKQLVNDTAALMIAKPRLKNTATKMYNQIKEGLQIPENIADPALLTKRKLALDMYNSMITGLGLKDEDFSPELVLAASTGQLSPVIYKQGLDQTQFKAVLQDMKNKLGQKKFGLAAKGLALQLDKFASSEDKAFINTILKPGSEFIPAISEKAFDKGINVVGMRKAQKEAKTKKSSKLSAFKGE